MTESTEHTTLAKPTEQPEKTYASMPPNWETPIDAFIDAEDAVIPDQSDLNTYELGHAQNALRHGAQYVGRCSEKSYRVLKLRCGHFKAVQVQAIESGNFICRTCTGIHRSTAEKSTKVYDPNLDPSAQRRFEAKGTTPRRKKSTSTATILKASNDDLTARVELLELKLKQLQDATINAFSIQDANIERLEAALTTAGLLPPAK